MKQSYDKIILQSPFKSFKDWRGFVYARFFV
ncbi:MAG TPA: hypothetical protein DHV15_02775 [Treponema sp.]|uniref:Uncharacterized protein n=1 Tax=Treponema denticola (strain ATCC 35405 / DSM 14222 / CIP 103919 / JCM 8153 / KCTC 15104) TaxID=243275 RepID=Q73J75_TREDE|nr:hypothetical protein TDE_2701 [Treponema denticola ATCC 35405]HCY94423.1 hypothetical protein [Treponema sp.]